MTKHERYQAARKKLIRRAMKRADEEVGRAISGCGYKGTISNSDAWNRVYHREMNRLAFEKGLVGWR